MPSQRSRFQSIGPSSVNMRTFFSTSVHSVIIAFMMANIPIGSANSASFGCPAATYRKKGTGKVKKKSTTLPK